MAVNTKQLVREVIDLTPLIKRRIVRPVETCAVSDVPPNQMSILSILDECGEQTMADLSKQIYVCRQQMTKLIDELEARSYVLRKATPGNRRKVTVRLTDAGQAYLYWVNEELLDRLVPLFDDYTDEQKVGLYETARAMRVLMHG